MLGKKATSSFEKGMFMTFMLGSDRVTFML